RASALDSRGNGDPSPGRRMDRPSRVRIIGAPASGSRALGWLRTRLLTGLLVLAPSVITIWILFRLLNWLDNLLGRYLRFSFFDYHRIPGLGLLVTLALLTLVGSLAAWVGAGPI